MLSTLDRVDRADFDAAVGLLALAGCGGQADPAPPPTGDATATTTTATS